MSVHPESEVVNRDRVYCWSLSGYCSPANASVGVVLEVSESDTRLLTGEMSQSLDMMLPTELLVMVGVQGAQAAAEILKSASGLGSTVTVMVVSSSHPEVPAVTV